MIAIFAPLHIELQRLYSHLEIDASVFLHPGRIWQGRIGTHELCLARTGIGRESMADTAAQCFHTFAPTSALLIGFAGATSPTVNQGDMVICDTIVGQGDTSEVTPSPALLTKATGLCHKLQLPTHVGRAVTARELITTPHEKAFLGTQHEATLVEMEGTSFATAAEDAGIPWIMVRSIVDTMDMNLPDDMTSFSADGTLAIGTLIQYLLRHPRVMGKLSSLHFGATKARDALTTFTQAWLAS